MHTLASSFAFMAVGTLVAAASFNQNQTIPQLLRHSPDLFYYPNLTAQDGVSTESLPPANQSDVDPLGGNWLGTALFGYTECAKRGLPKAKIDDAYYDMYYLTNTKGIYKDIDWNSAAAVEYLGPPANNKDSQKAIQKYLYQASQTTYSNVNPFQHFIHARCDDPENRCTTCDDNGRPVASDAIAYASDDDGKGYSSINFCPRFFEKRRLQTAAIDYGKGLPSPRNYDLRNYENTARVFLHELMHLNYFMGTTWADHISDLSVAFRGDPTPVKAYGPLTVKVLARYEDPAGHDHPAGYFVQRNADNMAWFAVARYVQGKLGSVYPHLPLVYRGPSGPPWQDFDGDNALAFAGNGSSRVVSLASTNSSSFAGAIGASKCGTDVAAASSASTITLSGMAADSQYPADYISQLNGWVKDLGK